MTEGSLWIGGETDDLADVRLAAHDGAGGRHIGCPLKWFRLVLPAVRGKGELAVALYLYRLRVVQRSRTVLVANGRLQAELGIGRFTKYRTLRQLAAAGIIKIKRHDGRALKITFTQKYGKSR